MVPNLPITKAKILQGTKSGMLYNKRHLRIYYVSVCIFKKNLPDCLISLESEKFVSLIEDGLLAASTGP